MSDGVQQTRRFARQYKKLPDNVIVDVDAAIETVAQTPLVGERKKGDLASLLVFRFRSQGNIYVLGYSLDEALRLVFLEAVGPHESFYRDVQRG